MALRLVTKARIELGRRPLAPRHFVGADASPLVETDVVDLVTIAFNRPDLIEHQHRLLVRYFEPPFVWTVADNSSDPAARGQIRDYCEASSIPLLSLRPSYYTKVKNPSRSHGEALNAVWRDYLRKRGARYVGFLDHDIFPTETVSVIPELERTSMCGRQQDGADCWYLWPGLSFFRRDVLGEPDFLPWGGRGDTGAANWASVYSHFDRSRLAPLSERSVEIGPGERYELIGPWLHVVNASKWRPDRAPGKERIVMAVLEDLLSPEREH